MKIKFFCDVRGTFDGGLDRGNALTKFSKLLNALAEDGELSFSFVSMDEPEEVQMWMNELAPYIKNSKVSFGDQYCSDRVITNNCIKVMLRGKSIQMIYDLSNAKYDKVYYAEDTKTIIYMVQTILKSKFPTIDLMTFESGGGIDELNKTVENYLERKKILQKK